MSDIPTTLAIFIAGVLIVYAIVGFIMYGMVRLVVYIQDKERYRKIGKLKYTRACGGHWEYEGAIPDGDVIDFARMLMP